MPKPKVHPPKEASTPRPSWPAVEEGILADWQRDDVFGQTLKRPSPKGNFVFYEGPPTANAAPGVHHVLARVFKDLIVRFRTMQGYQVQRKAGWDTHGLPVELQVEKAHGFSSKADIEKYGIAKFNAECRELVWKHKDDWEKLTQRIGFWLDLQHPYITYENSYIESVWAVIAQAHERGLLYPGHKVVPYCTRCGTALSSHEVAQGYREVTEDSVYVKCRVTQGNKFVQPGDFILTWTTTPWTLPGNVALAMGPEIEYVRVKVGDEHLVLAKALVEQVISVPHEMVGEFTGRDLAGVSYEPLFRGAVDVAGAKIAFSVVPADFVTTTDGTGVVHTAVMYGEDDYRLGEQVGLPKHHTVGLDGKFLPHVKGLAGHYVKDPKTQALIYDHLNKIGAWFASAPYTHDYPFCWRCDTPLVYYAKDSWFITMTKVKTELLKNAQAINWIPEYIKEGRFGEWLANVKDWAISRERYWGTPMPVWRCQTGNSNFEFRISKIDSKLKIQNSKLPRGCGRWQVVGSVAELKKLAGNVPKDLHRPFIDDVTWPCEHCGGTMARVPEVLDVWLDSGSMPFAQYHYPVENRELIEGKRGAGSSKLGVQFPADYICEAIDQTRGWFYTLLAVSTILGKGTSFRNVICLGHINDAKGQKMSKSKGNVVNPWDVIKQFGVDPLRWYFYTVNQPGEPKNFDPAQIDEVVKKVFLILQNVVSFWKLYSSRPAPAQAPAVTHLLDRWILSRLNAVVRTATTELEGYHAIEAARPTAEFVTDLSTWYVRRSRERCKAGDADAVATLGYILVTTSRLLAPFTPFFAEWLRGEVGGKGSVHLADWPQAGEVDQKVLEQMQQARDVVASALAQRMAAGVKVRQPLASVTGPALGLELEAIVKDELNVLEYRTGKAVELDTRMTKALELAGIAREFIRQVNALRRDAGLTVRDEITIQHSGDLDDVLAVHRAEILAKTRTREMKSGLGGASVEINGRKLKLKIEKV